MNLLPFAGGLSATPNGLLIFSVASAILYAIALEQPENLRRTIVKTMSIALLAVLVFVLAGPFALIAALAIGSIGDAFLAHEGDKPFLGGLSAFLIAHLFYAYLFAADGGGIAVIFADNWRSLITLLLLVLALFMAVQLWKPVGKLKIAVMIYILVITAMGVWAMTLDRQIAVIGALMFMTSDTLLAYEKFLFSGNKQYGSMVKFAVWGLYYTGQLLIALAFLI